MLDLSCPDWEDRLRTGRSLVPCLAHLPNPDMGERAVQVFNRLRLFDVPGTPTMEEAAGEWFRDVVRALFGSLDPVTRARLIREVFILVAKKNNKALCLDTPIATPTGFTTMRDVKVGDLVLDAEGRSTPVVRKSEVFTGRPCFEVAFSAGERVVCDADHLWVTECAGERSTKTTAAIIATLRSGARHWIARPGDTSYVHIVAVREVESVPTQCIGVASETHQFLVTRSLIPTHNTTGGALLMLTALLLNERPRAPFLLTGPVQKTADDAFAAIEGAVALDNVLNKKIHVRDHIKTIVHRETRAKLEIMTFDPDIVTGKKVVGGLIDEEHLLGKMQRANKSMVQLRGGMMPFPEAFLAIITTQSDEQPAGVFAQDLKKAREIRDGKRQGRTLPVLFEFPEAMQQDKTKPWRDPANWFMVNPNMGRSIALEELVSACAEEEAKGEAELRTWASQHLNIQIGVAMLADRWVGADLWEAQGMAALKNLDEVIRRSEVLTIGIDGGGLEDLLGMTVIGRERETRNWLTWSHAWADPIVFDRRKDIVSKLEDFIADGDLTIIEVGKDMKEVADVVEKCEASGLLENIGVDPAGIAATVKAITARGIEIERIVGIPQGWKLMGAIKTVERSLKSGEMFHGDTRLMAWCVGNARAEPRGNAVMITKQISGSGKIDPLMSLFDAAALMAMDPQPKTKTFQVFFA